MKWLVYDGFGNKEKEKPSLNQFANQFADLRRAWGGEKLLGIHLWVGKTRLPRIDFHSAYARLHLAQVKQSRTEVSGATLAGIEMIKNRM